MISFLMLTRAAIINWTTLAALPLAITFDAIEGELERQGVKLPEDWPATPAANTATS